jgi:ribonuclease D
VMIYKETISKEELDELPLHSFEGDIVIVDNKEKLREAVKYLSKFSFLGFDTETKPSFKKGEINHVALLQLSSGERAFLFRLNHQELPRKIISILSNPSILKAGIAIRDDVKVLQSNKKFTPAGFIELQDEAKERGINCFSLKKLSGIVLGIRISKAQQLSNWEAGELTEAQLRYAATDAWISYKIYEHFKNGWHEHE